MAITRASTTTDGTEGNGVSGSPSLSGDGTLVAFDTSATNLGVTPDPSGTSSVFLKNLTTGAITRVSTDSDGNPLTDQNLAPSLASDGSAVAFVTRSPVLVGGGVPRQVVVKSLVTGDIRLASSSADGIRADQDVTTPSLSEDGRTVAFGTAASNLVPNDTNETFDVFVKNLDTGAITRASTAADGTQGNDFSISFSLAADGRSIAFHSSATNLVAGDINGRTDVFVKNLTTGAIVNASTAANGAQGNNGSYNASVSRDGNVVAFLSDASNLVAGDTNGRTDVFVKNLTTGAITRVSTGTDGTQGNAEAVGIPTISADGTKVAFTSRASNIVPGDTNLATDTFVKDLTTGALTRVSSATDGTQGNGPSNGSRLGLSADGSRVAFDSSATNLVPGDTNNARDVFVADVICFATGTRIRTARGDVVVEDLRVGYLAVTVGGGSRPIRWIGSRTLDGTGRALPFNQGPVRIRAGAFGQGLPARDLRLSPGHPVLVGAGADGAGGVLVPAMCLINGTTIAREPATAVTYWHVELDAYDILLAEGLPAESYLDLGSRPWFAGSDARLHDPEFVPAQAPGRCRPVAVEGPVVEAERRRLDAVFAADLAEACAWTEAETFDWVTA
jgi:Tol biopolymer transport system component